MKHLIPSLIFLLMNALALAEERSRIFAELREAMTVESSSWTLAEIEEFGYEELRWRFVTTWAPAEIEIAARNESFKEEDSWWIPVVKRWGMIDHESALSFYQDQLYRAKIEAVEGTTQGRYSRLEYVEGDTVYALRPVFAGWAMRDAKGAWQYLIDLESEHRKMGLFRELVHQESFFVSELLGPLAMNDPDFVFGEFQRAGLCEELGVDLRPYILAGLAEGLPDETDWATLFGRLENELRHDCRPTLRVAQGPLFGRWLGSDSDAAEAWFESDASKAVFRGGRRFWWREDLREFEIYGEVIPLGDSPIVRAATSWLLKAPDDAMKWFRDRKDLIPALLEELEHSSPEANERRIFRRLLVFCLHKTERESLIRGMMNDRRSSFRSSLRLFAAIQDQESLQKELAELDLNDGFISEIMETMGAPHDDGGEFGDIRIE